ncbi:hypothetical protein [Butyrivibrio sp. VCB2006]|uniref:hypothetical protein n=1 Tax=Butyrivibrio sp. VCB2006 TaxID=1280679 RepID=UPI00040ED0A0|nr:hypothetical protein [Butyrivibrio sp. VCB2006]
MGEISMGYVLLAVHIFIVIIAFILKKIGILKVDYLMMVVLVCIPFWGMISAVIVSIMIRNNLVGRNSGDLEVMHGGIEESQSLYVEAPEGENVVPLEDALIMDDSATKRSVMLDVLMSDTSGYISVLSQARMNEDAEVVHYATTAMVEVSKEYELKLQEYSSEYARDPEKEGLLDEYIMFLEQYISSNIIQGQLLEIQKNTLMQLLMEKVHRNPSPETYERFIVTLLNNKQFSIADEALRSMEKAYPNDDRSFKLRFRYYYETGSGIELRDMVSRVKNSKEYYSREIRDLVSLWDSSDKENSA